MKRVMFCVALLFAPINTGCAPDPTPVSTEIQFEAMVGDQAFDCTKEYSNIGMDKGTLKPLDLRIYIHNVRLIRADNGEEVPFTLTEDENFQGAGVAMLDFENGAGSCKNGTSELNVTLKGMAPKYAYKGIKFVMGVPTSLNHQDLTATPAPLNVTTMSWSWKAGRIFMSAMGRNDKGIHLVHIGSTGCKGDPETGDSVTCSKPNRPEMVLNAFDPAMNKVIVDWGKIFSKSTVGASVTDCREFEGVKYCGCHSHGPAAICNGPLANFGITFSDGTIDTSSQAVFRVAPLQ